VNVIMTSAFVSGPTDRPCHSLQLNPLVNINKILLYRTSLTATFSPSYQSFVLLQGTCWVTIVFGSMSRQLVTTNGIGLTSLHEVRQCILNKFNNTSELRITRIHRNIMW